MNNLTCKICGNIENNKSFLIEEKMFGTHKTFEYFQCSKCGCFQIAHPILNMSNYYPSNYYSYDRSTSLRKYIENHILKQVALLQLDKMNWIGNFIVKHKEYYEYYYKWLNPKYINFNSKIVDIGCGSGLLLKRLSYIGFKYLYGIDPFIDKNITTPKYKIEKKSISELSDQYDFIMMHHSFEHMDNPHEVFDIIKKHLATNGTFLIRIPVIDSFSWEKYGVNWFQLDAPRHFFIHTKKSISILAEKHGLYINEIIYDSTSKQFLYSERYKRGLKLNDTSFNFSRKKAKEYRKKAKELNEHQQGDQACFILKTKNDVGTNYHSNI